MTFRETNTEVVYVPRRVIKTDLINGVPRTSMPEYRIWSGMLARCSNKAVRGYARYGGRGISVCDRWKEDFKNFYDDMGARPTEKHSIDRIDNDGDYEPENCRWATHAQQIANKSAGSKSSAYFWSAEDTATLRSMWGKYYTVEEISEVVGRSAATIRLRVFHLKLRRSSSTTRLVKKHRDLAHVLREKGLDDFVLAISEKTRMERERSTITASKAEALKASALARISKSNVSRSAKMKDMRASGMNLSEIGEHFGISRERVRQIEALGWPDDSSTEAATGIRRKISSTNPEVRSKKIDRLCRAWNKASREARLMFLNSAPDFIAESISVDDVEATVSTKTAA